MASQISTVSMVVLVALCFPTLEAFTCPGDADSEKLLASEAKCFSFHENSGGDISYVEAAATCAKKNKQLASVSSQMERLFVASQMKKLGWQRVAIGAHYLKSAWKWTADDAFLRGHGCYETDGDYSESATTLTSESAMNPSQCVSFCAGSGDFVFAALRNGRFCYCSSAESFGWQKPAADCSSDSVFSSYVSATFEDVYDNWQTGRPSVGGDCAAISIDHTANNWLDASCNLPLPFICKFGGKSRKSQAVNGIDDTSSPAVNAERIACSPDACYHFYLNPELTWFDADKFCAKYGGRLATIDSGDRQELINTMLYDLRQQDDVAGEGAAAEPTLAWIGASNRAWYDATNRTSLPAYRNWLTASQPEMPDAQPCTVFALSSQDSSFGWQTARCDSLQQVANRFVCVGQAEGAK